MAFYSKTNLTKTVIVATLSCFTQFSFSQIVDDAKTSPMVKGAITLTNNGVSLIPSFTLGKPATIFDLAVRKKRFSFEPQFRFAIQDAKPWSFIFWLRYKCIDSEKFKLNIGVHPAYVFQTANALVNGVSKELIITKRFLASEVAPTYSISKNISVGVYYLYSRGLADATKNTNFVSLNTNFSNIKLNETLFMKISPQFYYLKMDVNEGVYTSSTITLTKRDFPFSVATLINKKIQSTIVSDDVVWNISLIYSY